MDSTVIDNLQPPRFATGKPLLIAGLGERYSWESGAAIPGQCSASTNRSRTFRGGSARWPTASAAMAMTPALRLHRRR
jgi:hypothetical protein